MIYPASFVRATVGAQRVQLMESGVKNFSQILTSEEIEKMQVDLFNRSWKQAATLPFYNYWRRVHDLPPKIDSISDLEQWPVLDKEALRSRYDLVRLTPNVSGVYRTSGSTSEPFEFPRGSVDSKATYEAMWSYRGANGLRPFDSFVSASNILGGSGVSSFQYRKARVVRGTKDLLGNSTKVNGFLASDQDADSAIRAISLRRPRYLVGYPSAISAIARRARARSISFPTLTHAILTSECIEDNDINDIRRFLHVKVLIEYGTAEMGVIAGTPGRSQGWPIDTLWWSALIRTQQDQSAVVSSLTDRAFPLLNFGLSDILRVANRGPGGTVLSIDAVSGRTRDLISIRQVSGRSETVFARELVYLVRESPGVLGVQVAQLPGERLCLVVNLEKGADPLACSNSMSSSIKRNRPKYAPGSIEAAIVDTHIPGARGKRNIMVSAASLPAEAVRVPLN